MPNFTFSFVLNRGWIDKESDKIPSYEELIAEHHDEEDGKFEEAVDQFESEYNFRFEEE
jgi:protein KRI1